MTPVIILCTCGSETEAVRLSGSIVQNKLAACVNVVPGIRSVFRWQDQVETAQEWLLLIKSSDERYPELEQFIRENHSYEVPEVIAVPIAKGHAAYLDWLTQAVQ